MTSVAVLDTAELLLRLAVGYTMVRHGYNHVWGGGKLEGTARWFASLGLRPAKVHAMMSGYGELAAGTALIVGLLTPFAAAFVVGTMTVAFVTVHRKNGFFTMKEGWEHVMIMAVTCGVIGMLGPGAFSVDQTLKLLPGFTGWCGLAVSIGLGVLGAAGLLITCWRPNRPA